MDDWLKILTILSNPSPSNGQIPAKMERRGDHLNRHDSKLAFSMHVFAAYLLGLGVGLIAAPNTILGSLDIPATREDWVRILGWVVLVLGSLYWTLARLKVRRFFLWTIYSRLSTMAFFGMLVLFRDAAPTLLLIGALDGAGAWWTYRCLCALRHSQELS